MKSLVKNAALAVALSMSLAACSTSAVSTHGSGIEHTAGNTHAQDPERGNMFVPRSHHVSLFGDRSKAFVVSGQEHFEAQNYGLAEEQFRKAVETRSDNATAWLGLAASLDQLGRFDHSQRAYDQLLQLKSRNARVFNNLGYSHLLRGNYQKSRDYLNRAQQLDPSLEEIDGNIHLLEKVAAG